MANGISVVSLMKGVGILIDVQTGRVLDYVVLSKYCHMCAVKGLNK